MIRWLCLALLLGSGAFAQARVDPDRSAIADGWWRLNIELGLSDIVPYRVFTLDDPRRLVLDFEGLDWGGFDPATALSGDRAAAVRVGPFRPGWSRIVIDLAEPMAVREAGMQRVAGGAALTVVLRRVSSDAFAATAGAPFDLTDDLPPSLPQSTPAATSDFVVVIDPGHGGIDPGAQRAGVNEANLMLVFANEVVAELNAIPGVHAVLTRETDVFVPLFTRMSIARSVDADLFISLHADALEEDEAQGAAVYTLAAGAQDRAAAQLVERHARGDLLAGVDLQTQGDRVANALMDLARAETGPAGQRFADNLVAAMMAENVPLNSRPRREGLFAVLSAADFPSVLIEAGFLSNARDRAALESAAGRARIVQAIAVAVAAQLE